MMKKIDPELALRIVREETGPIAIDTETTGLSSIHDDICGWVVTNKAHSVYVPVRHEAGGNIVGVDDFEAQMAAAFKERARLGHDKVVFHNGEFDLRFMLKRGVSTKGCKHEDTMINEALINDLTRGYSLDATAKRRGVTLKDVNIYKTLADRFGGLPNKKQMGNFYRLPGNDADVVEYATIDGTATLEACEVQQPILDEMGLRTVHALECALMPYVAEMHNRGMRVDMERVPVVLGEIDAKIAEAKSKFPPGINFRSGKQLAEFYTAQGFTDFARTANGAPSFTEKWLGTNDIGRAILVIRQLENAISKFIKPITDVYEVSGRIHPCLHQSKSDEYGVAGARFSCSEPNMQAITKRKKDLAKLVRQFIIPDEGFELWEADASQQEPRLFTHYSEEPELVEGYRSNETDIHSLALAKLGMDDRNSAKRMAMGMLTMMTPPTLAGHMGWPVDRARKAHRSFLTDAFPRIGKFQKDVMSVFSHRGYVKSILGRVAHLENRRYAYKGVSRIIQNSGGDHMKTALLLACQFADQYPDDLQLLMSIHDSIIYQLTPGNIDKIAKPLIAELEAFVSKPPFDLIVPIPFEASYGNTWAEASFNEEVKSKKGWLV